MRASEESAEAIVVKRLMETSEERRAEEPRESNRSTILPSCGGKAGETRGALQLRQPLPWLLEVERVDSLTG